MRRCYQFTTSCALRVVRTGAGLMALSLLVPGADSVFRHATTATASHAETREEQVRQERLEAERIAHFRAKEWDEFLIALKSADSAALKPWLVLPITVGEQKITTAKEFAAAVRSPRVLRGINRARFIATSTGFTAEWSGDGATKYMRYLLTFNRLETGDDRYYVTNWSKWSQGY
ncbi:MAG: hypothetical protein ACAI35_09265 [Candidatus Methylacidiphilales bacterium]|nr:hypothetical protein [Candidatus Methylacidiphilales bacterium]